MHRHVLSYRKALRTADMNVQSQKNTRALKDTVGKVFESHRKTLWESHGFVASKGSDHPEIPFNVDLVISNTVGKVVALEEVKGHYLDSCFLERALSGFAKTINKEPLDVPLFIIHSFTTYSKFEEKLEEDLATRKRFISNIMREKIVYTSLTSKDRLPSTKWFGQRDNCYSDNVDDEMMRKDIQFILSLHSCDVL
jgi:hypothetical protein